VRPGVAGSTCGEPGRLAAALPFRTFEVPSLDMTQEPDYHPSGALGVAVVLSAVAGFVDAHMFLWVTRVFVANMSGNMIQLGMFAGLGEWRSAARSTAALAAFLAGVVMAMLVHHRRVEGANHVHPAALLVVESTLVLALLAVLVVFDVTTASRTSAATYLAIVLGATAMGMQTVALRRVGAVAVATTYGTGTIVRIGEKLALGARRADRAGELLRRVTIAVLGAILVGYVVGAAAAAAIGSSPYDLLIPVAALALAAAATTLWPTPAGATVVGDTSD